MTVAAAITQLVHIKAFFLAGHAKFTLVSKKSGARKTFEVVQTPRQDGWFVRLLVGPDNGSGYRYLCLVTQRNGRLWARLNKDRWADDAFASIVWLLAWFNGIGAPGFVETKFFEQAEFWHAGTCSRCGRDLTDPESIARGLGPVCAERSQS